VLSELDGVQWVDRSSAHKTPKLNRSSFALRFEAALEHY
jgi:hypothetical protein